MRISEFTEVGDIGFAKHPSVIDTALVCHWQLDGGSD